MAAFYSGEMKDTVQVNPAGAYGEFGFKCPSLESAADVDVDEQFMMQSSSASFPARNAEVYS
jgi:hypothetical protein